MRLEDVPLDCIKVGKDRRKTHPEKIKTIAESIQRIGLLQPIGITDGYDLVYGEHRLGAYKLLGKKTITCRFVKEGDEDLAEIDENTERINLDALEFTQAMARKKREWEHRNGKAKTGPKSTISAESCANSEVRQSGKSFAEEAAKEEGMSRRAIEVAAAIGEKLSEAAVEVIAGTPIADNKTALAAIAAEPKSKQVAAARRAVKERAAPKEKKPKEDREPKNGAVVGWTSDRDAEITSMMGKLVRLVDERSKHTGSKSGHNKCLNALRAFGEEWKSWRTGKT